MVEELLIYVSVQLDMPVEIVEEYKQRRQTLAEHRVEILEYLGVRRFGEAESQFLEQFLFEEASRLEPTGPLLTRSKQFLHEAGILQPAERSAA